MPLIQIKNVDGYPNYTIRNDGKIFSLKRSRYLKGVVEDYRFVTLYNEKGYKKFRVNRLVAIHFIPNPLNLPDVNHKDGNKLNNWDWNLEWTTPKGNTKHAIENGLRMGHKMPNYKSKDLNKAQRKIIISKFISGRSKQSLSNEYGVCILTIRRVIKGSKGRDRWQR